jgi:hypothetical protein
VTTTNIIIGVAVVAGLVLVVYVVSQRTTTPLTGVGTFPGVSSAGTAISGIGTGAVGLATAIADAASEAS